MYRLILSLIIFILLTGCSVFNNDKAQITEEQRFEKGINLLSNNKFEKAKNEFQIIIQNQKGTALSLNSYFHLGEVFFGLKNYEEAIYHFNYYSMFSNKIENVEKAQFMKSKCEFELTLDYKNDQAQTFLAISSIQEFLDNFPYSIYKDDAFKMIENLREKLAKKYFENGRLYLKIKKFESAVYYFDLVISDYYDTKYSDKAKISYIFTYIIMKDYDKAVEYFNNNKDSFKSSHRLEEAQKMLDEYKNGLGISGYYRLYK